MALTQSQLTALKADIAANTNTTTQYPGIQIKDLTVANSDHADAIAKWYSTLASPDFFAWQTAVPIDVILDNVVFANMTPAQAIPTTPALDVQVWTAKALACQGKQFNLQNLTLGKTSINAAKVNIRSAFQDCLTALPSKSDGTNQGAGWVAVQAAMQRKGNRVEQLLKASGAGSAADPATMGFEGSITYLDVQA